MSRSFSSFLTLETQSQRVGEADFGLISVAHDEVEDYGLITDPVTEVEDYGLISDVLVDAAEGQAMPLAPAPGL